jgi:hypothetical protein
MARRAEAAPYARSHHRVHAPAHERGILGRRAARRKAWFAAPNGV